MAKFRLTIIILFICSCSSTNNAVLTKLQRFSQKPIPENTSLEIKVTTIDKESIALYNIVRFHVIKTKSKGIILEKKSTHDKLIIGQIIMVTLCDIGQYQDIFRESDTTSIGKVPLIYGKQDGLRDNIDTLNYRGHFMINGKILNDNNLILDFADDAQEPVFEVCRK